MPHFPKPFFRTDRGLWYVQFKGKQFNLGPEQDSAFSRYHELMSRPPDESTTASDRPPGKAVVDLIDSFLDWCEKHREPRTYEYYQERCQSFVETIDLGMTVGQLKPFHVQQWVDGKDWNPGMKRGAMSAIQRAFNWAAKLGHIESSPIAFMEKPPQGRREVVIPAATYQKMLALTKDQPFRDLITLAWETGARPQELVKLEARHCDLKNARWVFPQREAKGKKHIRIVYLTAGALAITERLMLRFRDGKLLRNVDGKAWTRHSVNCRFSRLKKKLGTKFCMYNFRHTFAQRKLETGTDALVVATLLGHRDVSMLGKVYSHLTQNADHLRQALAG